MTNQTDLMPVEDLLLVANKVEKHNSWKVADYDFGLLVIGYKGFKCIEYNPDAETYEGYAQKDRLVQWLGERGVVIWFNAISKKWEALLHDPCAVMEINYILQHPDHTQCCLLAAAALIKGEEK